MYNIQKTFPQKKIVKKIKIPTLLSFTKQLALLLKSGVPILSALQLLNENLNDLPFSLIIKNMVFSIKNGFTLAETVSIHKNLFGEIYCALIHVGEQSGSLDTILKLLTEQLDLQLQFKRRILKALFYPCCILFISIIVSFILAFVVIPQFELIYQNLGAALPFFTRMIIAFIDCLKNHLLFIGSSILLCYAQFKISKSLSNKIASLITRLPLIGGLLKKIDLAHFCKTLAITFHAGVPLIEGLNLAFKTVNNPCYANQLKKISEQISQGNTLHFSMLHTHLFPAPILQLIRIGEESGTLEQCLENISQILQEEIIQVLDNMHTLIEPLVISFIGLFMGILLVAMYLPMFKLGGIF